MQKVKQFKYKKHLIAALVFLPIAFFQNCGSVFNSDVGFTDASSNLPFGFTCQENDAPDLKPVLKYEWTAESEEHPDWKFVMATPSVGDLDADGIPEVAFVTFATGTGTGSYGGQGVLRVINGATGETKGSILDDDISPIGATTPLLIDIDADGILNVTAKDKATGKEQSIKITASSGLTEEEINRMVNDGEKHATEDKAKRELVELRNQADQLIHTVQTSMTTLAEDQQTELKTLIEQLKMAVNGNDKAAIEMRQKALHEAYTNIMQAQQQGQADAQHQSNAANDSANEDVIDADFEDVSNG